MITRDAALIGTVIGKAMKTFEQEPYVTFTKGSIERVLQKAAVDVLSDNTAVNQCSKSPDLWWISVQFDGNTTCYNYLSDRVYPNLSRVIVNSHYTGYTTVTVRGCSPVVGDPYKTWGVNTKWIVGPIDDTEYKKKEEERKRVAEQAKLASRRNELKKQRDEIMQAIDRFESEYGPLGR